MLIKTPTFIRAAKKKLPKHLPLPRIYTKHLHYLKKMRIILLFEHISLPETFMVHGHAVLPMIYVLFLSLLNMKELKLYY